MQSAEISQKQVIWVNLCSSEIYPLMNMYQLGNPDTYININIYLYRETVSHVCIHIYIHTYTHTHKKTWWTLFTDKFLLNQRCRATTRMGLLISISMSIYLSIYPYIYIIYIMHIYVCRYIYMYMFTYKYIYIYIYIYIYMLSWKQCALPVIT